MTSSWPSWPMRRMSKSSFANRTASLWTLVTRGQVASMVARRPCLASSWTTGATPCAENITMFPSGTSSVRSTKTAPFFSRVWTTYLLCTISCRT